MAIRVTLANEDGTPVSGVQRAGTPPLVVLSDADGNYLDIADYFGSSTGQVTSVDGLQGAVVLTARYVRLPPGGINGQALVKDSTAPEGVRWADYAAPPVEVATEAGDIIITESGDILVLEG